MSGLLEGRVALVTGGGTGIGAAVARRFASEGAAVAVLDRDDDSAHRVAVELIEAGGAAMAVAADVGEQEDVLRAFAEVDAWHDQLDILVNVAGVSRPAMFTNISADQWQAVVHVNLTGTYYCCSAGAARLSDGGRGRIINVTSAAGLQGTIGQAHYGAAKAGVIGLTKSLAKELGRRNITANAVAPLARTGMTAKILSDEKLAPKYLERIALRRVPEPDEVAGTFVFLASDDASCMTGQVLCVDGGLVI